MPPGRSPKSTELKALSEPAAIASEDLSEALWPKVIDSRKVNDYTNNSTRFIVLAKTDHARTGKDKTSIVFSILKDKPGGLYEILGEFAKRKINLTKIESRPMKTTLGDYYFFVDMEGH